MVGYYNADKKESEKEEEIKQLKEKLAANEENHKKEMDKLSKENEALRKELEELRAKMAETAKKDEKSAEKPKEEAAVAEGEEKKQTVEEAEAKIEKLQYELEELNDLKDNVKGAMKLMSSADPKMERIEIMKEDIQKKIGKPFEMYKKINGNICGIEYLNSNKIVVYGDSASNHLELQINHQLRVSKTRPGRHFLTRWILAI